MKNLSNKHKERTSIVGAIVKLIKLGSRVIQQHGHNNEHDVDAPDGVQ